MRWLDRIHAIFRAPPPSPVYADESGLERDGRKYPYANLAGAVAFRYPNVVGDTLTVALDFGDGQIVVLSEHDGAWHPVLAALDVHPRVRRPSTEWLLVLVGSAEQLNLFSDAT